MKFYIESFGCQMNTADSEEMGRQLMARGITPTLDREEADWVLINTCTVRDHAEHKALSYMGRLRDWKDEKPGRRIVVAGCAAERLKDTLQNRFDHVDLVVGAKSINQFADLVNNTVGSPVPQTGATPSGDGVFDARKEFLDGSPLLAPALDRGSRSSGDSALVESTLGPWALGTNYTSFLDGSVTGNVTIMRGCNYSCTYCIVPSVRGREIYRPAASILDEVKQKAEKGLSEILLLGQTVNSYKPAVNGDGISDFSDLISAVDKVPGVRRIRFMSPHPFYLTDKLVRAMAENPNVCNHIHLPVQSGSTEMLKRMRRNYSREDFLRRVEALRKAVPGISITTDIIVGFCGETEADFQQTLSLIREADLEGAYCFKYSSRPGTESAQWADDVSTEVKEERLARLLEVTHGLAEKKILALKLTRQEILIENVFTEESHPLYEGKTRTSWNVQLTSDRTLKAGDTVWVDITETNGRTLRGHESA